VVEGRIDFGPEAPCIDAADVYVYVEDTTYADAPAITVYRERLLGVSYAGDPGGIVFTLDYQAHRPANATHTLRVLVDLDRNGRPGRGDYVSYLAVHVPVGGAVAQVPVRRID
jgi:hypothetical protein